MELEQIGILLMGSGAILFIAWYFFHKTDESTIIQGSSIDITVDAGYSPASIVVKKSQPVTLKIYRTDPSDCLDQLIIPQWNVVKALPLNKTIEVKFTPDQLGEFPFHCGMNMFHGKIVVID